MTDPTVLRENSVLTDSKDLGFPSLHAFGMKILLISAAVQWFNLAALMRILALRQQLTVYKRKSKKALASKKRSSLLVDVLKALETLEI